MGCLCSVDSEAVAKRNYEMEQRRMTAYSSQNMFKVQNTFYQKNATTENENL